MHKFANMDFSVWGSARDVSVQTVKEVWWDTRVVFPLIAKYNRADRIIEGIEEPVAGCEDCPPTAGAIPRAPNHPLRLESWTKTCGSLPKRYELSTEGAAIRVDAVGRRYKLDNFGTRLYKGSGRPP